MGTTTVIDMDTVDTHDSKREWIFILSLFAVMFVSTAVMKGCS